MVWVPAPFEKDSYEGAREDLLRYLDSKKIGTRLMFARNVTKQPYFKNVQYRVQGTLDKTDAIMSNTFWLGVFPGLTEHLDYVAKTITEYFDF